MTDTTDTTNPTDTTTTRRRRRRLLLVALALAALLAAVAVIVRQRSAEDDPVDEARALLQQERRFDSSRKAVQSFALVYQHRVDATKAYPKDCDVEAGRGRCLGLNQAASWTLNFSPASGHCTQPAVQEGRLAMLDYVTASVALGDAASEPPPLPPIPTC